MKSDPCVEAVRTQLLRDRALDARAGVVPLVRPDQHRHGVVGAVLFTFKQRQPDGVGTGRWIGFEQRTERRSAAQPGDFAPAAVEAVLIQGGPESSATPTHRVVEDALEPCPDHLVVAAGEVAAIGGLGEVGARQPEVGGVGDLIGVAELEPYAVRRRRLGLISPQRAKDQARSLEAA